MNRKPPTCFSDSSFSAAVVRSPLTGDSFGLGEKVELCFDGADAKLLADDSSADATLTWNQNGKYTALWVRLKTGSTKNVFLQGIESIELPIAHAEGRIVAGPEHVAGLLALFSDPRVSDPIYDLPRPIDLATVSAWIEQALAEKDFVVADEPYRVRRRTWGLNSMAGS